MQGDQGLTAHQLQQQIREQKREQRRLAHEALVAQQQQAKLLAKAQRQVAHLTRQGFTVDPATLAAASAPLSPASPAVASPAPTTPQFRPVTMHLTPDHKTLQPANEARERKQASRKAAHEALVATAQAAKAQRKAEADRVRQEREEKLQRERSGHEIVLSVGRIMDQLQEALHREASQFGQVSKIGVQSLSEFYVRYAEPAAAERALAANWNNVQVNAPCTARSQARDECCVHFAFPPNMDASLDGSTKEGKDALGQAVQDVFSQFGAIGDVRISKTAALIQFLDPASAQAALSAQGAEFLQQPIELVSGKGGLDKQPKRRRPA